MSKRGSGSETFWLWDGEAEFQGQLLNVDGHHLTARMRQVHRWTLDSGAPGRPVPLDLLERQRGWTLRACFGQSPAILLGALLEFRIGALQPSRDRQFDYVLTGAFASIGDEHLETLSRLDVDQAHRYLQSHRGSLPSTGT